MAIEAPKTAPDGERLHWPEAGLESVAVCPVCGQHERQPLYTGLTDRAFFCAPGEWRLFRCARCRCAYLDPRPSANSIHLAYETYYTHIPPAIVDTGKFGALGRFRHALGNGYRNWRFGTRSVPATRIGILAAWLMPGKRRFLENGFRNLPRPTPGARLLDVGFGDGAFLERARSAGWQIFGVDADPVAVQAAQARGLHVRLGQLGAFADMTAGFDGVTLSHVIEHLHDPRAALKEIFGLLRPSGWLWVETPNIDSYGHARFGRHWRGLEPPRHLVLFHWQALETMLRDAGFADIRPLPQHHVSVELAIKSRAISRGADPRRSPPPAAVERLADFAMRMASQLNYRRSEYVTLVAFKRVAGTRQVPLTS